MKATSKEGLRTRRSSEKTGRRAVLRRLKPTGKLRGWDLPFSFQAPFPRLDLWEKARFRKGAGRTRLGGVRKGGPRPI